MKFDLDLAGKKIGVNFDNLAEQANGNILVYSGDTMLLTTCVMAKEDRENLDFFPLTVDYEEKYYAAGKIKSSRYMKREGRPSDEAICNARLIDRAIRPRFPEGLRREVQVIATVLSWDKENDPDVLGLIGASLALSISDIPWNGPIAAVRVCRKNGKFILNPTYQEKEDSDLDIVISGVYDEKGELLINMFEGGSDEVDEQSILEAVEFSEKYLRELIKFQEEIREKIGKEKEVLKPAKIDGSLEKEIGGFLGDKLEKA